MSQILKCDKTFQMPSSFETHAVAVDRQVLSKQREDDPWQELDPSDVSVVWDDEGFTYLRAIVNHFTWFGSARRTTSACENPVDFCWRKSVLVVNHTNSVAHVTPMPASFTTSKEPTNAVELTFLEASVNFETEKKTEHLVLPMNSSSQLIPVGGSTQLFLRSGTKEMRIIICFLPERDKTPASPSTGATSPRSGTSLGQNAASSPLAQVTSMRNRRQEGADTEASTAAAPTSGASRPLGRGLLSRLKPMVLGAQSKPGQEPPEEWEEMVYSMTKDVSTRRRLTLNLESVNRKTKILKNAQPLENYAMMLAKFGNEA